MRSVVGCLFQAVLVCAMTVLFGYLARPSAAQSPPRASVTEVEFRIRLVLAEALGAAEIRRAIAHSADTARMDALYDALERREQIEILSHPRMRCIVGTEGSVSIGDDGKDGLRLLLKPVIEGRSTQLRYQLRIVGAAGPVHKSGKAEHTRGRTQVLEELRCETIGEGLVEDGLPTMTSVRLNRDPRTQRIFRAQGAVLLVLLSVES